MRESKVEPESQLFHKYLSMIGAAIERAMRTGSY